MAIGAPDLRPQLELLTEQSPHILSERYFYRVSRNVSQVRGFVGWVHLCHAIESRSGDQTTFPDFSRQRASQLRLFVRRFGNVQTAPACSLIELKWRVGFITINPVIYSDTKYMCVFSNRVNALSLYISSKSIALAGALYGKESSRCIIVII